MLSPCNLTTIGILSFSVVAAAIMPWAMMSQRMIPPKMLTMMALTYIVNQQTTSKTQIQTKNIAADMENLHIRANESIWVAMCLCTLGSDVMILKASVTCSTVAPPPTSRKLAGAPPCSLIMSIVDMARPAPFTAFVHLHMHSEEASVPKLSSF